MHIYIYWYYLSFGKVVGKVEEFRPETIKRKIVQYVFNQIMSYAQPKPLNIEKILKVFFGVTLVEHFVICFKSTMAMGEFLSAIEGISSPEYARYSSTELLSTQ